MNTKQTMKRALFGLTLLCALTSEAALAASYQIVVDTSTLNGSSGFIDLQLNPSDGSAPSATANVSNLLGSISLFGAPNSSGDVIGALPATVTLTNSTAFNDYFQPLQFGTSFSVMVDLVGYFSSQSSLSSTAFALSLYDASGTSPLLTTDPTGSLALFQLAATGITFQTFAATNGGVSAAQVTPATVPLPAAGWLFLSSLLPLFRLRRSDRHRA